MAGKQLPTEVIVTLYHQLANLSAKHLDRNKFIKEIAEVFSVSFSTVHPNERLGKSWQHSLLFLATSVISLKQISLKAN